MGREAPAHKDTLVPMLGGNHPCERRAENGEQRANFGKRKSDILLINL